MITVTAKQLTGLAEARAAIEATARVTSRATMRQLCTWEHSPLRAITWMIQIKGLPQHCSGHLCRHKVGVEWFALSKRADRGGAGDDVETRNTPTELTCIANAQALISISHKRLCHQASESTRIVWEAVRGAIEGQDPVLASFMVPQCVYRGGICPEPKPCGQYKVRRYDPAEIMRGMS